MKIGVNLYSIRNLVQTKKDLINTLKCLKKDGCDFVQFSGSPVSLIELKEVTKVTKMPIILTHVPFERIIHDTNRLIKEHQSFGCNQIGLGMIPDKATYADDKKIIKAINELEIAAKKIKEKGMTLFHHNHQFEFRKLKTGETIFNYMKRNAPHLHFTLDTYWVQYGGASIIDTIHGLKGRIECVHLKDYKINDQLEPEFAPLGDGNINLKQIIKETKLAGSKYFIIEQDNAATKKDGYNDIVKSIRYIKENF